MTLVFIYLSVTLLSGKVGANSTDIKPIEFETLLMVLDGKVCSCAPTSLSLHHQMATLQHVEFENKVKFVVLHLIMAT